MGFRKPFNFEERQKIQELLEFGHGVSVVANLLTRSKNGVATEVRNNGGVTKYKARAAQKQHDTVHKLKSQNMSEMMKGQPESFGMHRRIIELEEQVVTLQNEVLYLYQKLLPLNRSL